jgi:hypothetical protein
VEGTGLRSIDVLIKETDPWSGVLFPRVINRGLLPILVPMIGRSASSGRAPRSADRRRTRLVSKVASPHTVPPERAHSPAAMVPIDEQHRIVAEYRGACGQFFPEGKYIDAQAAMSRAIHAVLDMMLGHARVSGLDEHVREAAYFAIGCAAMVFVLFTSRTVLNATWPGFASIQPHHKQLYTLMNLLKSALLGLQATSFSWLWYSSKEYLCTLNPLGFDYSCDWSVDTGHQAFVKQISLLYAAVDVVALLVVPKLPLTTKIHHWAVAA